MKKITWVIITNTVKAEIYELKNENCKLVTTLSHPEGRLKSINLTSDQAGYYEKGQAAHGQFSQSSNPHEEEHKHFAKELANFLEQHRQSGHYQALILCAEPHFQGLLNQVITEPVRALVIKFIKKDYIPLLQTRMKDILEAIIDETI